MNTNQTQIEESFNMLSTQISLINGPVDLEDVEIPGEKEVVRIIFNNKNVEQSLAAIFKCDEVRQEGFQPILVPYDRLKKHTVQPASYFVVMGVELKPEHLDAEVKNVTKGGTIFAVPESYKGVEFKSAKNVLIELHKAEHIRDWRTLAVRHENLNPFSRVVFTAISLYQNMHKKVDEESLLLAYHNLGIIESLVEMEIDGERDNNNSKTLVVKEEGPQWEIDYGFHILEHNGYNLSEDFKKNIKLCRTLIERNYTVRDYVLRNTTYSIPTANVSDIFCTTAMRLIGYAHKNFVIYEDLVNCRLMKIVTEHPATADTICDILKPSQVWMDGKVRCIIVELPQMKSH